MTEPTAEFKSRVNRAFREWMATDEAFTKLGIALGKTDEVLELCFQAGIVAGVQLAEERVTEIVAKAEGRHD